MTAALTHSRGATTEYASAGAGESVNNTAVNWDILALARFCLAFIVVQYHLQIFYVGNRFTAAVASLGGKAAVIGFLLISGFSIHASLARQRQNFLARRWLRIYPAYAAALALAFALQWKLGDFASPKHVFEAASPALMLCNAALLQMYACKAIDFDLAVWSLSLEFSFYLLAYFAARRQWALDLLMTASLIVFCLPEDLSIHPAFMLLMHVKAAKFVWAFLLGYRLFARRDRLSLSFAAAIAAGAFALSPLREEVLGSLTIALVVATLAAATRLAPFGSRWMNFLGDLSYPLYLAHLPIYIGLNAFFGWTSPLAMTLAALAGATLVLEGVEKPFRGALRRFGSLRAKGPKLAEPAVDNALQLSGFELLPAKAPMGQTKQTGP